jgi:hypothetical protein
MAIVYNADAEMIPEASSTAGILYASSSPRQRIILLVRTTRGEGCPLPNKLDLKTASTRKNLVSGDNLSNRLRMVVFTNDCSVSVGSHESRINALRITVSRGSVGSADSSTCLRRRLRQALTGFVASFDMRQLVSAKEHQISVRTPFSLSGSSENEPVDLWRAQKVDIDL